MSCSRPSISTEFRAVISMEMGLDIWTWPNTSTFSMSSTLLGNHFQRHRGNHGFRHFQISSISTPTGGPALDNVLGRPRAVGAWGSLRRKPRRPRQNEGIGSVRFPTRNTKTALKGR